MSNDKPTCPPKTIRNPCKYEELEDGEKNNKQFIPRSRQNVAENQQRVRGIRGHDLTNIDKILLASRRVRCDENIAERRDRIAYNAFFESSCFSADRRQRRMPNELADQPAGETCATVNAARGEENARRWQRLQNGVYEANDDSDDDESYSTRLRTLDPPEVQQQPRRHRVHADDDDDARERLASMYETLSVGDEGNSWRSRGASLQTVNESRRRRLNEFAVADWRAEALRSSHFRSAYRRRAASVERRRVQATSASKRLRRRYGNVGQRFNGTPAAVAAREEARRRPAFAERERRTLARGTSAEAELNPAGARRLKRRMAAKNGVEMRRIRRARESEIGEHSQKDYRLEVVESLVAQRDRLDRKLRPAEEWAAVEIRGAGEIGPGTSLVGRSNLNGLSRNDRLKRENQARMDEAVAELDGPKAKRSRLL